MASPRLKSAKLAVKHTWPLVLMVLLDQAAYGVPVLRRIPLWARVLALATAIARAIQANRRRALLRSRLDGKRVLITGGASGIGLLLARRCVRHGAHVVIWDVQREACARALEELRALVVDGGTGSAAAHSMDVTDRERVYAEVERLRREAGGLDVVVLNAGIVSGTPVVRADEASMVRTMDVNAMSHFWLIKAVLPVMLESNSGQIVTISSAAAFGGGPGLADYCASKSASFAFTECVRMEVRKAGRMGVTVTTICPFLISTGMFEGVRLRFSWLLPLLEPESVAERVMDAIKAKDAVVVLPWVLNFMPLLRALLPVHVFDSLGDIIGTTSCMDSFVGRHGPAQAGMRS